MGLSYFYCLILLLFPPATLTRAELTKYYTSITALFKYLLILYIYCLNDLYIDEHSFKCSSWFNFSLSNYSNKDFVLNYNYFNDLFFSYCYVYNYSNDCLNFYIYYICDWSLSFITCFSDYVYYAGGKSVVDGVEITPVFNWIFN